jgi:hypothetical protein
MLRIAALWGWFMSSARLYQCDDCGVRRSFSGQEPRFCRGVAPCACGAPVSAWMPVSPVRSWFRPYRRSEADLLPNLVEFGGVECFTWGDLWSAIGVGQRAGEGAESVVSGPNENGGLEGDGHVTRHLFDTGVSKRPFSGGATS